MNTDTEHEAFPQPGNQHIWLWRYMDLSKFVALLEGQALFLSRSDLLGDTHEGAIPRLSKTLQTLQAKRAGRPDFDNLISEFREAVRYLIYVSCWHANEFESEAMWKLYCGNTSGVAIKTTYKKLNKFSQLNNAFLGLVTYKDYRLEEIPVRNSFSPLMHKRIAFAHENEVRLVVSKMDFAKEKNSETGEDTISIERAKKAPPGVILKWDMHEMVDAIYINPYAPDWYVKTVSNLIGKYDQSLQLKIEKSEMREPPIF